MKEKIIAIVIGKRVEEAPRVQEVLTIYGCIIKTRLGLHDHVGESCSNNGLVLLHVEGDEDRIKNLENDLNQLEDVTVSEMELRR